MHKTINTYKSYKDLVSLKEHLVNQDSLVTFQFPNTLPDEYIKELEEKPSRLNLTCGCTSFSIVKEVNQINFVIKAPSFVVNLSEPYLKSVKPTFTSELGNKIVWDIKFYVNPKK